MNNILKQFLDENESIDNKIKHDTLIKLGLYEKEYEPDNFKGNRGEYAAFDYKNQKYYKAVPLNINDDVYRQILNTSKAKSMLRDNTKTPALSIACYVIAVIIFIVGLVSGIYYGNEISHNFDLLNAAIIWCVTAAYAMPTLVAGKLLVYLHRINNK